MPGPKIVEVAGDATQPARVDVVVVGGGIIGIATALELAERGLRVAVCEKGAIAAEQSSRNWGWVRLTRRDPREIDLMIESIRLWGDLDRRIGRATGYRRCGIATLIETEAELAERQAWLTHLDGRQASVRMLPPREAGERLPWMTRPVKGVLLGETDGRAEPQMAAPAMAEAARARGATILTGCAVRVIETSAGQISGVVTERGLIGCAAVVVAGGAWSRLFLGNAGVDLPQLRVVNSVLRTGPVPGGPEESFLGFGIAARRRQDGGYSVSTPGADRFDLTPDAFRLFRKFLPALRSQWRNILPRVGPEFVRAARVPRRWGASDETPFERARILDPVPDRRGLERTLRKLSETFPAFEGVRAAQFWAGAIDVTPDAVPVISAVDGRPGLFVATGFSGHGFGLGPGAGRLMADLVTGRRPVVDAAPFRLSRFSDGSEIRVIAGI